jgi:hypothetical protein
VSDGVPTRMNESIKAGSRNPSIQWNSIAISICHGHRTDKLRKLTNIIKNNIWKNVQYKKEKEKRNHEYHAIPFRYILPRYFSATLRPSRMWQ